MPAKNGLQSLLDLVGKFVTEQQGDWNHDGWEMFLEQVSKLGISITDETKRNFGNLLESCKQLYPEIASSSAGTTRRRTAAKPKSTTAKPKTSTTKSARAQLIS